MFLRIIMLFHSAASAHCTDLRICSACTWGGPDSWLHGVGMAPPAIQQRECHSAVTDAAVLAIEYLDHGVPRRAFFHTNEYFWMTKFASVPDCVSLMGEDDVRYPSDLRVERKILLHRERLSWYRDPFEEVYWLDQSHLLRFFPIQPVPEALFRKRTGKLGEVVIGLDNFAEGVTSLASLSLFPDYLPRARFKYRSSFEYHLSVMAGAAIIIPLYIVRSLDGGGSGLHCKTDIDVADAAGEFRPVHPMIKNYRSEASFFGVVVEDNSPIFVRERPPLLDRRLSPCRTGENQYQRPGNKYPCLHLFHRELLPDITALHALSLRRPRRQSWTTS